MSTFVNKKGYSITKNNSILIIIEVIFCNKFDINVMSALSSLCEYKSDSEDSDCELENNRSRSKR